VALVYQNERAAAREEFTELKRALKPGDPLAGKVDGYLAKL
jgi:hypothetical protein